MQNVKASIPNTSSSIQVAKRLFQNASSSIQVALPSIQTADFALRAQWCSIGPKGRYVIATTVRSW